MAVEIAQLEHLVGHGTAGDADDELQHKGGHGIARVTGQDIGQSQTDRTGQAAGNAVQQQGGQGGEGVAQMERGAAVERHTEEQVCHQAQRGHNAGQGQLLGGKGALVQHTAEQDDNDHHSQQQPHCSCRHDFSLQIFSGRTPSILLCRIVRPFQSHLPIKLLDIWVCGWYAPIIRETGTMKIPRIKFFYGVSLAKHPKRGGVLCFI